MRFRDTTEDRRVHEREQAAFIPSACPNDECPSVASGKFRWVRHGWHETQRAPFRVRRFRCKDCLRAFSTQTFHVSYWQKRPELDQSIFFSARGCSGNRQIAIALGCGKSTVAEKISRLARGALRFHVDALSKAAKLGGDSLFDGLGTFENSQYTPFWLNLGVHRDTSFLFGFTDSPLRRSGTMRPAQRRKRARLEARFGRPNPRAIEDGTTELLAAMKPFLNLSTTRFVTDRHMAYPRALRRAGLDELEHVRIPGSDQRTPMNPLFEINLADMTIRHGNSSQKRETIAFNKRRQAGLERAWLWLMYRNYMASRRVKWKNGPSPAMLAGVASRRLTFNDIFEERILPRRVALPAPWQRQALRQVQTPAVGNNRIHDAVFCT